MTQAQKDAKKIQSAGLKDKTLKLINLISNDPLQYPPEFEYLKGEMKVIFLNNNAEFAGQ
jgi:Txe/YoeB family toxin of Txe-Axe toxin-antitoxin module